MKELVSFGKLHIVMAGEKNGTSVEQWNVVAINVL